MIPKPGARVRIRYGRPFEVAPGEAGLAGGTGGGGGATARDRGRASADEPPGRHPPGHALAVDQPAARRAAGAAGAAAGRRASGALAMDAPAAGLPAGLVRRCTTCRCPSVAVGNLTVGGSGKTPIAIWIARHYVGARPPARHPAPRATATTRRWCTSTRCPRRWWSPTRTGSPAPSGRWPTARRCWCSTTPISGSTSAATSTSLVMSAETTRAVRWPLPAGPWREGWDALDRADAVIVTRKRATRRGGPGAGAASCEGRVRGPVAVAHLGLGTLEGLVSGTRRPADDAGRQAGGGRVGHRRSRRVRGPDQGHRRGGAGGHLEGPPRLPRRGRRLAGPRRPPGRPRGDHPEGRRQAARPLARRGARAAGGAAGPDLGRRRRRGSPPCWMPSSPPSTACNSSLGATRTLL